MRKLVLTVLCNLLLIPSYNQKFEPDIESLKKREIPSWFNEAKFGIFVVWGPYSVPSYIDKGYAEWYGWDMNRRPSSIEFHEQVYGEKFEYELFADLFKAELFDPDFWLSLFSEAGAKYVVTTANYHDGFAMYPTQYAKTSNTNSWNSMVTGPQKDLLGEINQAGEKYGLKMGIYYSLYEWFHPLWNEDKKEFAKRWLQPKFKEVITKYKPWFIFLDGEWAQGYKEWRTEELAAWLYNESPVKDYVVTNDRWGQVRGIWGDVFSSEYGGGRYSSPSHPWQEDRGIGHSYGYNRNENIFDYDSPETLIKRLSSVVGGGGNFLLCVGPTGDGRIPVIMQERLLQIGGWLKINGDAIYGTMANPFWPRMFDWGTITTKPGKLYLHIHNKDLSSLQLNNIMLNITKAVLLHENNNYSVNWENKNNNLIISWDVNLNNKAVTIIALDIAGEPEGSKIPRQFGNGIIEFNCWAMNLHGEKLYQRYNGYVNDLAIKNWTAPDEFITGEFHVEQEGLYDITLIYKNQLIDDNMGDLAQTALEIKINQYFQIFFKANFYSIEGIHDMTLDSKHTVYHV